MFLVYYFVNRDLLTNETKLATVLRNEGNLISIDCNNVLTTHKTEDELRNEIIDNNGGFNGNRDRFYIF